jgi:hypothetical protein
MKSFKSYLLTVAFALSVLFAPSAGATTIEIYIKTHPSKPPTRQTINVNADGTANIKLPAAGNHTITYAAGPNTGKVIWSGEVTKAQSVSCRLDARINDLNSKH